MTAPLYFTRAELRRDASMAAVRQLLNPTGDSARFSAGHQLVWTLFAGDPAQKRDFLWREAKPGLFYVLSRRRPEDPHGLFDLDEPKPFEPNLREGDRLAFSLRANATVARGEEHGRRGKPCDVVMDVLYRMPKTERAVSRSATIDKAGYEWLARRGEKDGFDISSEPKEGHRETSSGSSARVLSYRTLTLPRRGKPARIGVLDFEGKLQVTDPERFLRAIANGVGRAKAFGCGLMLIRRV
ncbi:MAG: type I-E CRISPR-associated protein Cas6/Cse3/CasE [Gemmatimonadaceae bacterium]|nr:type I-E CRISPR-associated protein Cas6/Cse3/CasE [Gemmatimonadaceae bacterium]MBA3558875.1 type I-E CRISPR-associated protein Cas6/Cse3/CasE [Gemmatimonadaceae bacterium]